MNKVLVLLFFSSILIYSQDKPCTSPDASQFDFWIGEWKLDWKNQEGETEYGTNTITRTLGGCVFEENFSASDGSFSGRSFSVYNPNKKLWLQTWVDNAGGYLNFTGGYAGGKMILSRKAINKDGKEILQRMVFYDISSNELWWNWESSRDDGKSWNLLWKIHYERK